MPSDKNAPDVGDDTTFAAEELLLMGEVRSWVEMHLSDLAPEQQHRALLGIASELVDAAADKAATHSPGVRVVQLGLLAERLTSLACELPKPTKFV